MGSPLVVNLPTQVIVFISHFVQALAQMLNLSVQTIPHALETLFLFFLLRYARLYRFYFLHYLIGYFLKGQTLTRVVLSECEIVRVQLLVGRRVDDLRIYLLFVVIICVESPFNVFFTAGREADTVNI